MQFLEAMGESRPLESALGVAPPAPRLRELVRVSAWSAVGIRSVLAGPWVQLSEHRKGGMVESEAWMHPRESGDRAWKEQPECVSVGRRGRRKRRIPMMIRSVIWV